MPEPMTSALRRPLDFALGSQAKLRVLRPLFLNGQQLAAPILVQRTDLAKASVRTALIELVELGLVDVKGSGRAQLYSASTTHPFAAILRDLFRMEASRFNDIVDALRRAGQAVGARGVWMYGSVARGQDMPSSDLDIALIADASARDAAAARLRELLAPFEETLRFRAAVTSLDENDVRRLANNDDPWWRNIARESFIVFGLGPADILRPKARKRRS